MNAETIMDALTNVKSDFIIEASPGRMTRKSRRIGWLAAAIAVISMLMFAQTPVGVKAVEYVKEQIVSFIEELFPPRDIGVNFEGEDIQIPHVAGGQEPVLPSESRELVPGFAIYYDPATYKMTEENGITYIRQIPVVPTREELYEMNDALFAGLSPEESELLLDDLMEQYIQFDEDLPPCEIEIRRLTNVAPEIAAVEHHENLQNTWDSVSEIQISTKPEGMFFSVNNGTEWNSPCEDIYFVSDGLDGSYQIRLKYFLEATEGHGVHFHAMLDTFEIIIPES